MVFQDAGDGANQTISRLKWQPRQQRHERHVGHDAAGENFRVFHLAGHHRVGDPGLFHEADARAELSERDPMDPGARLRGGLVQIGKRFFFGGNDGDVVPHGACGVQNQEGEAPVTRNQT